MTQTLLKKLQDCLLGRATVFNRLQTLGIRSLALLLLLFLWGPREFAPPPGLARGGHFFRLRW
jgi:hypothetical protein